MVLKKIFKDIVVYYIYKDFLCQYFINGKDPIYVFDVPRTFKEVVIRQEKRD